MYKAIATPCSMLSIYYIYHILYFIKLTRHILPRPHWGDVYDVAIFVTTAAVKISNHLLLTCFFSLYSNRQENLPPGSQRLGRTFPPLVKCIHQCVRPIRQLIGTTSAWASCMKHRLNTNTTYKCNKQC